MTEIAIESILQENRLFPPSAEFAQNATIKSFEEYQQLYAKAKADPPAFWAQLAEKELHWFEKWSEVLEWQPPFAKWFVNGKINICYNCIDRHLTTWRRNKAAIIWEGEPGDSRTITYEQLHREVCQFANALKELGVKKGDVVGIYMPMIPEAAIAMLACARIGAPHSVVFGGFSADALRDRLNDAAAKVVITADGGFRKDKVVALKEQVDLALADNSAPSVEKVLVVQRSKEPINMVADRDYWWHDLQKQVSANCPAEPMDSEDMLFILYTSGSTGKPKGVVHTTGGYNLYTHITSKWIFDLKDTDVYWCTADVGWITGHSYIVYGPLSNGATTVMYEGVPRPSNLGCFWDVIEKYRVNIFYTAPTAIRAFIKMGEDIPNSRDLSSLRLLGTVGEPINPEAWMWYHRVIGKEKCPIVDTWWQTETGSIMITNFAGVTPAIPGTATLPMPGVLPCLVDENGKEIEGNSVSGNLCIKQPWPSIIRTTYNDHERCKQTYFSTYENMYFTGDGAMRDDKGNYKITGRVDDVLNVSGHRIGTAELENAMNMHAGVIESAIVGYPHDLKGQGIYAFLIYEGNLEDPDLIRQDIIQTVSRIIGPIAKPDKIQFVTGLPKTRSGKIMRRILRKIAENDFANVGDTSTLLDPAVVEEIIAGKI